MSTQSPFFSASSPLLLPLDFKYPSPLLPPPMGEVPPPLPKLHPLYLSAKNFGSLI